MQKEWRQGSLIRLDNWIVDFIEMICDQDGKSNLSDEDLDDVVLVYSDGK
jgi:hypothetical protein